MTRPFLAMVIPVGSDYPDQGLPGAPVYPSHGLPGGGQIDNTLPAPPPGYPTPGPVPPGGPVDPGYGRPGGGPHPGHGLPGVPGLPSNPIVLPDPPHVSGQPVPPPPPTIWPPLPPSLQIPALILVWIVGVGYRWIHSGGQPDQGLPPAPVKPDQGLPPTAQPRR